MRVEEYCVRQGKAGTGSLRDDVSRIGDGEGSTPHGQKIGTTNSEKGGGLFISSASSSERVG